MDQLPRNEENRPAVMLVNRQLTVFLVCLLIASVFWLLLEMSGSYPATLTFPVHYSRLPERKVVMNDLPSTISVDLRTTGFRILYYRFLKSPDPIEIDVASGLVPSGVNSDVVVVPTRYFIQDFSRQLGDEVQVSGFRPDSIVLMFSDRVSRRVPVLPKIEFGLKRQFDTVSGPVTKPDSVTVSGPPSVVSKVKSVSTMPLLLGELSAPLDTSVRLQQVPLAETEPSSVRLRMKVEKFTEGVQEIEVLPVNVPEGFILKTFPAKVRIRYQVSLSGYSSVEKEQFKVVVDAGAIPAADINLLPLRVVASPAAVRSLSLEPSDVEFILRKK